MWQRISKSLLVAVMREATRLRDEFLPFNPTDTVAAGHRLKPLRGRLSGIWQYDLPGYHRMWYRVDDAAMTVTVEYIGPHP